MTIATGIARFDAPTLARAWLSVAQASGPKGDVPAFARTIAIEEHLDGIRLVATDRYVLLTAWVPTLDDPYAPEPELDEAPDRTVIAHDPDGRGRSLLGYALSLVKRDGDDDPVPGDLEIELRFDVRLPAGTGGDAPTLDGLEPTYVVLDVPDVERVYLPVIEASYPSWRALTTGFSPVTTHAIALNPELLERLAKLRRWHKSAPLVWTFGGPERVAAIELGGSEPHVSGLVMPMRWVLPGEPDPETEETETEEAPA